MFGAWKLQLPIIPSTPLPASAPKPLPAAAAATASKSAQTPASKSFSLPFSMSLPKSLPAPSSLPAPKSYSAPTTRGVKLTSLIIPVAGGRLNDLHDSFSAARSGGRVHRAIDIMSPRGTPVLAASDGEIVRVGRNRLGGKIIYQLSADKKMVFYYAHLDRYANGLSVGNYVKQGDIIGFVGNTGNAGPGNYHLHFSILTVTDPSNPKKLWKGGPINPYPLLRRTKPKE
jgi:murein DD-endopeptidase MepM/ murein hydrolase activator NlpD